MTTRIRRLLMIVGYNGANYYGYQRQETVPTIQGTIETALKEALEESIEVYASGRTDKGVHAYHQPIHFDTKTHIPTTKLKKIINAFLPNDIYLYAISDVSSDFHARYDVIKKEYVYKINTNPFDPVLSRLYWFVEPFNIELFNESLKQVVGTHDFYAFSKRPKNEHTTRTIEQVDVKEASGIITISITGNGFLRYMVRNIISACVLIASKQVDFTIHDIFNKQDNQMIKRLARPEGLYLNNVYYEDML